MELLAHDELLAAMAAAKKQRKQDAAAPVGPATLPPPGWARRAARNSAEVVGIAVDGAVRMARRLSRDAVESKKVSINAVPKDAAGLEQAQEHFRSATRTDDQILHKVESCNVIIWTTGCERVSMDEEGVPITPSTTSVLTRPLQPVKGRPTEGWWARWWRARGLRSGTSSWRLFATTARRDCSLAPPDLHTTTPVLETRRTRFAGHVTSKLGDELTTRIPPRHVRHRTCQSPGCRAKVYWPSAEAFRATCREFIRSDDCWHTDGLIHSLGLVDKLEGEQMLDLGSTYNQTHETDRFAETCALTSDIDELSVCANGHIFGIASVEMEDSATLPGFTSGRLVRMYEQSKTRADDPDLKNHPRFCP